MFVYIMPLMHLVHFVIIISQESMCSV